MAMIGQFPTGRFKKYIGSIAYKISFRIITRSISSLVNFHNLEYKPKTGGFCVANHTSPIDVMILSSQTCFCLVLNISLRCYGSLWTTYVSHLYCQRNKCSFQMFRVYFHMYYFSMVADLFKAVEALASELFSFLKLF